MEIKFERLLSILMGHWASEGGAIEERVSAFLFREF